MAFDFVARAVARQEKQTAERLREQAAEEKRWEQAASLETAFLRYAKQYLYRENMAADRDGSVVTFREGSRVIEITVVNSSLFSVSKGIVQIDKSQPWGVDAVKVNDENALMDMLEAWALAR